jgi:hypothetical protein
MRRLRVEPSPHRLNAVDAEQPQAVVGRFRRRRAGRTHPVILASWAALWRRRHPLLRRAGYQVDADESPRCEAVLPASDLFRDVIHGEQI